jgi:hypothetical protein
MMRRTKVLHSELQQHLSSELGKLSDMSTGEQHIIYIKDEEDGTPVGCVLNVVAIYRAYGSKGGGTTGVLNQGVRRVGVVGAGRQRVWGWTGPAFLYGTIVERTIVRLHK